MFLHCRFEIPFWQLMEMCPQRRELFAIHHTEQEPEIKQIFKKTWIIISFWMQWKWSMHNNEQEIHEYIKKQSKKNKWIKDSSICKHEHGPELKEVMVHVRIPKKKNRFALPFFHSCWVDALKKFSPGDFWVLPRFYQDGRWLIWDGGHVKFRTPEQCITSKSLPRRRLSVNFAW